MRILITGASGYLGTTLRPLFANDDVSLLSRKPLSLCPNEQCFRSGNIQESGWWSSLSRESQFDAIFHLAEPVKVNIDIRTMQSIIDGHVEFMGHFSGAGATVIYPLTAYLYDRRLSRANATYAGIKRGVYERLKDHARVAFPVIHPIRDADQGLGRLIHIERRIPIVNMMCAFEATVPVLRLEHLRSIFADPKSIKPGRMDIFSEIVAMKHLFKDDQRANVIALSRAFRRLLMLLSTVQNFNLLVHGRKIDDSVF